VGRSEVIEALARVGDVRAAEAIVGVFEKDRIHAKQALQQMGAAAEPAVLPLLKHTEWSVRHEACQLLAAIGTPAVCPPCRRLPATKNGLVQQSAKQAMEAIKQRK